MPAFENAWNTNASYSTFNDIQINNYGDQEREDRKGELVASIEKGLPRVLDAYFDPTRICLPGTRQVILKEIDTWSHTADSQSIYWLKAEAGAGKSTISHTIADRAEKLGQLGACFFLHRDYAKRRDPRLIINTLAFRLAFFNADIAAGIKAALDKDPDLGFIDSIQIKFDRLILDPITAVKTFVTPILVVIDDLDSLDTKDEDARCRRSDFLDYIGHRQFPSILKVLVTSRPERDIAHAFERIQPHIFHPSNTDITCLARKLLDDVAKKYRLQCPWPEPAVFDALVQRSGQLFIWVKTACQFIGQRDPQRRLEIVLKGDPTHGAGTQLYKLYRDALLNHAEKDGDDDVEFYDMFRTILGCIANLRNPLTPKAIDSVLGLPSDIQSRHTIELFGSFLHITEKDVVRPIHPSFIEFLKNEQHCRSCLLFIGPEHEENLAKRCLKLMLTSLKRNVCDLDDPLCRNSTSTKEKIPEDILYACQFWADHLQHVQPGDETYMLLKEFFFMKVLFWLEVLSLAGLVDDAIPALLGARMWLECASFRAPKLLSLINDAQCFVDKFRPVLLKSAGCIYESALPLAPHGTVLFQNYSQLVEKLPLVYRAFEHWEPHRTIEVKSIGVKSAAWSPDGTKIVMGAMNHAIFICNAADGSFISEVLQAHTSTIKSVTFSSDGRMIASGSKDCTIRIWNMNGNVVELYHTLFHDRGVYSIAFSPDGMKVISGSKRIYIWDVKHGTLLHHLQSTGTIFSLAFSPDGLKIVSGSYNGEVCIWDTVHRLPIREPFNGHNGYISSVAFSPDGEKIISGGADNMVCIWSATNGTLVGSPLIGHKNTVHSVGFSPDGMQIVSGSADATIRLWDVVSGTQIGKSLMYHTSNVFIVAFSPDGKQILSGSGDATMRIWSVESVILAEECDIGHSGMVEYVAFSADGSKICSCSEDNTVCVWNAIDGTLIGSLEGHTDTVQYVRFSPDGRKIASASCDHTVRIWEVPEESQTHKATSQLNISLDHNKKGGKSALSLALKGHTDHVSIVEFSPDGARIVTASKDSTICMWDIVKGTQIGKPLDRQVTGLGSRNSYVMSFSPDGSQFISADEHNSIRLWSAAGGTLTGYLQGHHQTVICAIFSLDGAYIISGSLDHTIRLWNVTEQSLISTFPRHYFNSWRGTALASTNENAIPEYVVALYDLLCARYGAPLGGDGWIRITASKRLWIPLQYHGKIVVNGGRVCIGTATGHVVIIDMK